MAAGIKAQKEVDESREFSMSLEDLEAVDASWFGEDEFHEEPPQEPEWEAWDEDQMEADNIDALWGKGQGK